MGLAVSPCLAEINESEFGSEEKLESGFVTSYINDAIERGMSDMQKGSDAPKLGYKLSDYASAPKFGGYFIGSYTYSDQPSGNSRTGENFNKGFSQRLVRLYVDGTILKDFKYRIQMQTNNDKFHMKDFFVEWGRYKEVMVKVGQFKRAFTFENPYNPWDVGTGDYSQLTKKLAGMGDYCGEAAATGGRDQGLQVQGDLFPVGKDGHRLVHYQLAVYNGQGINCSDADGKKDLIGTLQFQPVKDLFVGVFGWTGNYVQNGITVDRNRYAFGVKYEHNNWSVRAEWAHSQGHKISDYVVSDGQVTEVKGTGKADAWYATVGVPVTDWLKVYLKYDAYRDQATWASCKSIYSIAPNFRLHKNLMFQLQYNYNHDRTVTNRNYNELWAQTYVRF